MEKMIAEIDKAIDACTNFKKIPPPPGAIAYDGSANGWRILVIQFPMPNRNGFGYDGTATGVPQSDLALADPKMTVCRLRREMAEKAFKHAERLTHS
jgi:hypothetical protein